MKTATTTTARPRAVDPPNGESQAPHARERIMNEYNWLYVAKRQGNVF
jgi:hypothetical protein